MVWHIKKTSIMTSAGVVYYTRVITVGLKILKNATHILLKQKQKKRIIYGEAKTVKGWDVTAVNEG